MSCDHYPTIGPSAKDCWETLEIDMQHQVRRCKLCGEVKTDYFTSYKSSQFMSERHRRDLETQRQQYGKDIEQPWKNGKPNEKFAKAYENEPDKLVSTYTPPELRRLDMPKLAQIKEHATHT